MSPVGSGPDSEDDPHVKRALIALSDRNQTASIVQALAHLGFVVDGLDSGEEGARLIEQGVYTFLVTTRTILPPDKGESLYQRVGRMNSDTRRQVFLVLVGDQFRTGDGTQAWAAMADLVLHPKDVGTIEKLIRSTMSERTRLYQTFLDSRQRYENALT